MWDVLLWVCFTVKQLYLFTLIMVCEDWFVFLLLVLFSIYNSLLCFP